MEITLNKKKLVDALKKAVIFCAMYDTNNILSGVNINVDVENKKLEFAATDGDRLFYYPLEFNYTEKFLKSKRDKKPINVTIPANFIKSIKKGCAREILKEVLIEFKGESVYFENLLEFESIEIKTITGEYPKYKQLLPSVEDYKKRENKLTSVNATYLKQICSILEFSTRANYMSIYANNLESVVITTEEFEKEGGKIILMPVQTEDDRQHKEQK